MFKNFKSNNENSLPKDKISEFLNSLNYWQQLNLFTTILQAKTDITFNDAKGEAMSLVSDIEKMKFELSEVINSPSPRRDYRLEQEQIDNKINRIIIDNIFKIKD